MSADHGSHAMKLLPCCPLCVFRLSPVLADAAVRATSTRNRLRCRRREAKRS